MSTATQQKPSSKVWQAGQAMVEFPMVALFWCTMIFGVAAFSLAVYGYSFVCQASRDAARYAMVRGSDVASSKQATCSNIKDFVLSEAHGISPSSIVVNGSGGGASCYKPMFPDGNNNPGSRVKVVVTYNFQPLYPMLSTVLPLTSTSEMVIVY